jgi:short-subunit dehydrogenase
MTRHGHTETKRSPQTVLITGASRGLGLDLARLYAERGEQVAICARDEDEVERARRELAQTGARIHAEVCDAADPQQVERLVAHVNDTLGPVDMLITCAATIQVGPLEAMTTRDFEEAMAGIFWTTYHPTMAVLGGMRARGRGHIVHVTSFGGRIAAPHMLPYCAAKFAATGFSEGLRAELLPHGIQVTTITPGLLRTGAHVNAPFKGQHEKELLWFSAGLNLPLISLSSEAAAKRIARAIDRKRAESSLTLGIRAAIVAKALMPDLVSKLTALQARLLPKPNGSTEARRGIDVARAASSPLVRRIERWGRPNAERHHAYPGPLSVLDGHP